MNPPAAAGPGVDARSQGFGSVGTAALRQVSGGLLEGLARLSQFPVFPQLHVLREFDELGMTVLACVRRERLTEERRQFAGAASAAQFAVTDPPAERERGVWHCAVELLPRRPDDRTTGPLGFCSCAGSTSSTATSSPACRTIRRGSGPLCQCRCRPAPGIHPHQPRVALSPAGALPGRRSSSSGRPVITAPGHAGG